MSTPSKRFRIIELGKSGMTKSAIVEQLVAEGYDNVSYQYVYNTLKEKQIVVPSAAASTVSKSKRIKELFATGISKAEIVKTMIAEGIQVDYHYVFMITKYHVKKA